MSQGHSDLGPELRQLAQAVIDRLDPAVRAAATMASETLRGPGRCQQAWCPVCALAALVKGEQHPLLNVIAEHSVSLMSMVRTMAAEPSDRAQDAGSTTEDPAPASADHAAPPSANGRYQQIPIVIETLVADD